MQVKPNIDYLQVQPIVQDEQTTESGIIMSTAPTDTKQKIGIVLAVGNGLPDVLMTTDIGEVVLYQEGSELQFYVNNTPLYFVREMDVISKLDFDPIDGEGVE